MKNKKLILAMVCIAVLVVVVFVSKIIGREHNEEETSQHIDITAEWAETNASENVITDETEESLTETEVIKSENEIAETEVETTEEIEIETKAEIEVETEARQEESNYTLVSLGTFRLTAYCNCKTCCGVWAGGATASGVMPKENHTIAVDTRVIPFGTEVMIYGKIYIAEDTGSAIIGNSIDIYFEDHQDALNFGMQWAEVSKVVYN